jgi:hypothetical protein
MKFLIFKQNKIFENFIFNLNDIFFCNDKLIAEIIVIYHFIFIKFKKPFFAWLC